jgi:hypothetical protein
MESVSLRDTAVRIPSFQPEEALQGWLMRLWDVSHISSIDALLKRTLRTNNLQAAWGVPGGVELLWADLPSRVFDRAEDLLQSHTLFPLYERFSKSCDISGLRDAALKGRGFRTRLQQPPLQPYPAPSLRFCPECLNEDETTLGYGYFRRSHQASFIMRCASHRTILYQECRSCRQKPWASRNRLPSTKCVCGKPSEPVLDGARSKASIDADVRLARLVEQVLTFSGQWPDEMQRFLSIAEVATFEGFRSTIGTVPATRLLKSLKGHYDSELIDRLGTRAKWFEQLALLIASPASFADARFALPLIGLLFEGVEPFSQYQLKQPACRPKAPPKPPTRTQVELAKVLKQRKKMRMLADRE